MDHILPPPYSVTDLYSNSGSRSSTQPHPALTTSVSNFDTASVPSDATSSIGDPAVYTPPYTEDGDGTSHVDIFADGMDNLSSPTYAVAASASAYFESRPAPQSSPDILLVHYITISPHTQPSDLPFPQPEIKWLERDVLPQDWETFVNYLIPSHTDVSNHHVADRKLKAELTEEEMQGLTLDQSDPSRTDLRNVDAQLRPLRQSHTDSVDTDVNATVIAWNEGFFGPRNVFIEASEPQPDDGPMAMPGSWTNDPAEVAANTQTQALPCSPRRGFGGGWIRADSSGFHIGRSMISADNNGIRIGRRGLVADSNGLRIGNLLVADGQGFRLGPLRADANGFRIGGGSSQPHVPREHHRTYHREHRPVHVPPIHRGRPWGRDFSSKPPQRDRSHSTSSSSSSSASSIESAGSLPDYDHLKDAQLLVAKNAVKEWLNHPEQPITKQTVTQIRDEIKAAKRGSKSYDEAEQDSLRKEVRDLFKEFKAVKKLQRKAWKDARRERRSLRREAKRTRKAARREVKHAEREVKHAEKEAKKAAKQEIKAGGMRETAPSIPATPAIPEVPGVRNPPGAWPLDHEYQGFPHPQPYMPTFSTAHSMPHMGSLMNGGAWPFTEYSQATNMANAAAREAEGRRVEAEAIREEALRRAEETRQKAQTYADLARRRAEERGRQAEGRTAMERRKAEATAALAHKRAEEHRQRAEAKASVARQKATANHILADANRMQADVNRIKMQAGRLQDKERLEQLDRAEKLEEDADKLKRDGERLMAEASQLAKDLETYIPSRGSLQGRRW